MKSKKIKNIRFCIINSIIALACGLVIYILFCNNTYINLVLKINKFEGNNSFPVMLMRCYFADFLWAYSLCFALMSVLKKKTAFYLSSGFAILWEVLQYSGVVSGTGDIIDILMYITACVIAVLILNKKQEEAE